jgi:hypothetical protein
MAAALVTLFVSAACGHLPWSGGNDLTAAACPAAAVLRPLAAGAYKHKPPHQTQIDRGLTDQE